MPQGKTKVKVSLPINAKSKRSNAKGPSVSKRVNCPVAPKKLKHVEAQKLKKIITKTVNRTMEEELRNRAMDGKKSLLSKSEVAAAGARKKKNAEKSK